MAWSQAARVLSRGARVWRRGASRSGAWCRGDWVALRRKVWSRDARIANRGVKISNRGVKISNRVLKISNRGVNRSEAWYRGDLYARQRKGGNRDGRASHRGAS
jgi:hypothetical protein